MLFIALGIFSFLNWQAIYDTIKAAAYKPSVEVAAIERNVVFTSAGTRIFHATQPRVVDAGEFNNSCPRQEAASAIVGCYTPNDEVFIYNVTNEKLNGIEDVTAVHEFLHAVWRRMGSAEQQKIGAELQAVYQEKADAKLKERMAYYERTEKGQEINELHSILGTEMADLSPELEAHYARYFSREKVVQLYDSYQHQYELLETKAKDLQGEMKQLADSITSRTNTYNTEVANMETVIATFNSRARNQGFSSQAQFDAERGQLIRRINALDASRDSINQSIEHYNELRTEYQRIASEIQALNNSLDSFKALERPSGVQQI